MRMFMFAFIVFASQDVFGDDYKWYEVDWAPMKKHAQLYQDYQPLRFAKGLSLINLTRKKDLIVEASNREPNWVDGLWLSADALINLGQSYNREEDLPLARSYFVQAQEKSRACLKLKPDFAMCKFWLGAAIGRTATVDGVFSSLRFAEDVERYWLDTVQSGMNHKFDGGNSLQGSTRYALGIFNRVIPDSWVLKFFFGVRGNIKKSIAFHRQAITIDGDQYACSNVMYAAALLCSSEADPKVPDTAEANKWLDKTSALTNLDASGKLCQDDVPQLKKNGKNIACGYTTTKQQDVSEENLKKSTDSEKAKRGS